MSAGLRCPVCDSPAFTPIYGGLSRCSNCTHVWAGMSLDWEALRAIYQRNYFFGEEYSDYLQDRRIVEKNFARRTRVLDRYLTSNHRKLFEIGCAYGLFLNLVRQRFESVAGIDISEDAVAFARTQNLDVAAGDFLSADLDGRTFDVVCLWDTIEHLADPRAYLSRAAGHVPTGGLLALTTGDIGSLTARLQRERWRLIHPPSHLQYFTRPSMQKLLERTGFRIVHFEHCGFSRSVHGMLHNVVALRWGKPWLARWLTAPVPPRLDLYLNLHDIMYVIAERR